MGSTLQETGKRQNKVKNPALLELDPKAPAEPPSTTPSPSASSRKPMGSRSRSQRADLWPLIFNFIQGLVFLIADS